MVGWSAGALEVFYLCNQVEFTCDKSEVTK